jgi:hypothetical protein
MTMADAVGGLQAVLVMRIAGMRAGVLTRVQWNRQIMVGSRRSRTTSAHPIMRCGLMRVVNEMSLSGQTTLAVRMSRRGQATLAHPNTRRSRIRVVDRMR